MHAFVLLLGFMLLTLSGSPVLVHADPMTTPCAPNYLRTAPHYCMATIFTLESWYIAPEDCHSHLLTTVPSTATQLHVTITHDIFSSNAANLKILSSRIYHGAACTGGLDAYSTAIREFVATPKTRIFQRQFAVLMPIVNGKIVANASFIRTGKDSSVRFDVVGYYD